MADKVRSDYSRVWMIEGRAAPHHVPEYVGRAKFGDSSYPFGDVESGEMPSETAYGGFDEVIDIPGAEERPTGSIQARYEMTASALLRVAKRRCALDLQGHIGKCSNPRDFNKGWEKVRFYENLRFTSWGDENFGALQSDERAIVNENLEFSAQEITEMGRKTFSERAGATVTREIISIDVCDSAQCGDCGDESDGCQKIIAVQTGSGASPGTSPMAIFSGDGGGVWAARSITTLQGNEPPSDSECVGDYFVVISRVDESINYALTADLLNSVEVWAQHSTGIVWSKGPNAIVSLSANETWIVGEDGYIYFSNDIVNSVEIQDAGEATTEDLLDVDAYDNQNVLAVGEANAVVVTADGGNIWTAITGPAVGVQLNCCLMKEEDLWLIGDNAGDLWYTTDRGTHWHVINLVGSPTSIQDIKRLTDSVLSLSAVVGGAGRVYQSIDGGRSWYTLPESGVSVIPANQRINQLAVCAENPTVLFGGGLGLVADGIIVKAA